MTSKKLSKHEQDFADAMALKLRINREQRAEEEKRRKLIEKAGDFRVSIAKEVMREHPGLSLEKALEMMMEGGF